MSRLTLCWDRLIPESPRWLLTKGRVEEAEAILRDAAKRNGVRAPEVIFQPLQVEDHMRERKQHNICDLVKSNNMLRITSILCFVWTVINCGYYSLSLNTSNLHGNPFLNFFWSGAVEIPANILIPERLSAVSIALEMMGKFEIAVAFVLVYVYTAELYPTVLRNTAVGNCCAISGVGGIIAPYFVYLGTYNRSLPYILMGGFCILGGLLSLLLPETRGISLPDEINQMQTMRWCKKRQKSKNLSSNSEEVENVIAI
ncbi:hypothetical protein GJAV_G00023070 [Gymnothorax javanicus]|nr:hypothetical protein GJAV_G00023070 [Gymnothorax javanicus]